jgi:hypothetical protein
MKTGAFIDRGEARVRPRIRPCLTNGSNTQWLKGRVALNLGGRVEYDGRREPLGCG